MKKFCLSFGAASILLIFSSRSADAALIYFSLDGQAQWNVLSLTDGEDQSALTVKKVANAEPLGKNAPVALLNESGNVTVQYGENNRQIDISDYKEDIVEIEEHDAPKRILIQATENGFAIKQRGITAETNFPIKINSPQNKISVDTSTGNRFLTVLPYEAVSQLVSTNIISSMPADGKVTLEESASGELSYMVNGEKGISLLNVFSFSVPVSVEISAVSGKVVNIKEPLWFSVVDFLLV